MRVWAHIANTLQTGAPCSLVTVASAAGSTPREAGARMVVRADGGFYGTIGGGTLEFEAIKWAASAVTSQRPGLFTRTMSLGPDLGQCCGGRTEIAVEVLTPAQLETARQLAELERSGAPFSTVADLADGQPLHRRVLADAAGPGFQMTEAGRVTETFGASGRPVYLFGAGHVGKALVLALAPLPFQITWIDSRRDIFPAAVPANTTKVSMNRPAEALADAPSTAFVLAMTHSHALDEDIMAAALSRQRFAYCGVIGSNTKRARFIKRLRQRGIPESAVAAMVCPVGTPAIRSKLPAAIATGIAVDFLERDECARQQPASTDGLEERNRHGRRAAQR
ncbi:MAG: xanthine dehydrogenase accessory protein XdhC [Roseibium sp.]|nr:xanthine dehydrogenase accessory protein XdhC [Roseibium sp.]